MILSDEQMRVVNHGRSDEPDWSIVELPVGPQQVPDWALDLSVYWADGYGNAPSFKLKCRSNLRNWANERFSRTGDLFLAKSGDGRAEAYYQGGPLTPATVRRFQTADGKLHEYRPATGERVIEHDEKGRLTASYVPFDEGEWVDVERLCTRQEQGFGGAHIDITLTDGREVTLRGPWHGPCPPGYQELAYVDVSQSYYAGRPWRELGGTGGLLIEDDLFIRIFARFLPHLRLARVGKFLQPLKPEWDAPKAVIQERERMNTLLEALRFMAESNQPVKATEPHPPWAFGELTRAKLAERHGYTTKWQDQEYVIGDAGRALLASMNNAAASAAHAAQVVPQPREEPLPNPPGQLREEEQ